MNNKLLIALIKSGAIKVGSFVGKSGSSYTVETDIRVALSTHKKAVDMLTCIYKVLDEHKLCGAPFLGVPETGSFIAQYLNQIRYSQTNEDFYCNMLRSVSKEYQIDTHSENTVLPLIEDQEYSLIEDDIVSGNSLLACLKKTLSCGIKIANVIVLFARDSAHKVSVVCQENNIHYFELFNIDKEGEAIHGALEKANDINTSNKPL